MDQYRHVLIGTEIFRSTITFQYSRNSHILAKFIQDNETTDMFPSEVQFYFTYTIELLISKKTYYLAFVKWYLLILDQQIRFYCETKVNDESYNNIKL